MNFLNFKRAEMQKRTKMIEDVVASNSVENEKGTKEKALEKPSQSVWKKIFQPKTLNYPVSQPNAGRRGSSTKTKEMELFDLSSSGGSGSNH